MISATVPFLRPFSRAASHNTAGRTGSSTHLSPTTVFDIWIWRAVFSTTPTNDVSWMTVPLYLPPLLRSPPRDDAVAFSAHVDSLMAHASYVFDVDSTTADIGFVVHTGSVLSHWGTFPLPDCLRNLDFTGFPKDASINVCEFFASVVTLSLLAPTLRGSPGSLTHIHINTDNSSALSWMTRFRTSHPLVSHLLQLFSHLQVRYHLLVTMAHIEGKKNIIADAASRRFQVPNGSRILQTLQSARRFLGLPPWTQTLLPTLTQQSEITWRTVVELLTVPV